MEECESLDSEMTELTEFQCEASDVINQDDEDEVEELQNSLREVVQDQSVKPKLQCLMVDPSFSMVTVQSEDSGIVWETASSRCSTPWASETSSLSEACSMEGSGAAGKITIIFEEDKIVRRRTRSGRNSRLKDRVSRSGSSRSTSALGVERPEMAEVSLPNEKQKGAETDFEGNKNKDQQLFSLISEGYEILNIRVPSKLPTVDEEESTELQDNLSYLDQTPKIRSRNQLNEISQNHGLPQEVKILECNEPSKEDTGHSAEDGLRHISPPENGSKDIDYFEKFTLLDEVVPGQKAPDLQQEVEDPVRECKVEPMPAKVVKDGTSDSFVFVTEAEIVGEHLDEVFYGEGAPANEMQQRADEGEEGSKVRRESQRSMKESGSVLFGSEETTLTPIYISAGPPKIIDPILLEEPTAMSFLYSDLYEDAVGERRKSDEEYSEIESVTSEKSFKKCLSDSEEADGYLEKFILKDDTPTVDLPVDLVQDKRDRRMMWSQSKFEMTGCLMRAMEEEEDAAKTEDTTQAVNTASVKDSGALKSEEQVPDMASEGVCLYEEREERLVSVDSIHEDRTKAEGVQAQDGIPEGFTDTPLYFKSLGVETPEEHQQASDQSISETQDLSQTHAVQEKEHEMPPTVAEGLQTLDKLQQEDTVGEISQKAAAETEIVVSVHKDSQDEILAEDAMRKMETSELSIEMETLEEKTTYQKEEIDPGEAAIEVSTDCEPWVHAFVKVTEKTADEMVPQTEVRIDLQDVTTIPQGETRVDVLPQNVAVDELACFVPDQGLDVKTKVKEKATESGETQQEMIEHKDEAPSKDSKADTQRTEINDHLIVLVPKGQAVEMDINMSPCSQRIPKSDSLTLPDLDTKYEHVTTSDHDTVETISLPQPKEPVGQLETLNETSTPTPSVGKAELEDLMAERNKDEGGFSPLRSFTPQEDLSLPHQKDLQPDAADVEEKVEVAPEEIMKTYTDLEIGSSREEGGEREAQNETPEAVPEVTGDDYEMITEEDTRELAEPQLWRDVEEPVPVSVQEVEVAKEKRDVDVFGDEDLIEADYDIIDAEEHRQARLAAELQGMDWFCLTCQCLLSQDACDSGDHDGHEVTAVDKAFEDIRERLSDWISELQERSENIEDLVSELELAYHSVEDQCVESEAAMQAQNDEAMALVMERYNEMSVNMEEEKKAKLEQLYDQIVSFRESIDSAKATLETTAREADADARTPEDIHARLKAALESTMSLELGSKGLLVFEDYAKGNASGSQLAQRKGIAVPQRPTLEPQEAGSAASSSVAVYWRVNPGDVIDCFQVYCMEEPQGAVSEEYRVTVKESYCVLEELEPDKSYKVWVMAVNYTGCSLPSERLVFTTAPSVPVIDSERCTVTWDSAKLRWSPAKWSPGQSFILEYCRQYELEGDGLRSIAGIKNCEHGVRLQPNENYLFYIKAVNEAGVSEQSEAALISTKGTRFHLLNASAHPALELSEDQTAVYLSQDAHEHISSTEKQPPSVLGELLPARGHHYWETIVSGCAAYRLGVTYSSAPRKCPLGENKLSWCFQCIPSPSGCSYQLLHGATQSCVFVMESPERVGTLLDYRQGRLCFYNAQTGQLLGSFRHDFARPCHPVLTPEVPGRLAVFMVTEVPEFADILHGY
ncbi:LOW QUALITY PROTEIN: cardiomyopathy-associated protein 5 [Phycodurus eques]|uniref:LOW QUALITY PROTEIN: cardiomyopathy-associated protein 5 n=1 Tax=Phycodurus eques TaxID=693459 RepID=UPI002ACE3C55|nr:LOW QUALITY PROTEIN: cardiomyopathy-associated protein 5 [Phycodurus eques]